MVKTRYLLYIEDDWWAVQGTRLPRGKQSFMSRAMEVLRCSAEEVDQVSNRDAGIDEYPVRGQKTRG